MSSLSSWALFFATSSSSSSLASYRPHNTPINNENSNSSSSSNGRRSTERDGDDDQIGIIDEGHNNNGDLYNNNRITTTTNDHNNDEDDEDDNTIDDDANGDNDDDDDDSSSSSFNSTGSDNETLTFSSPQSVLILPPFLRRKLQQQQRQQHQQHQQPQQTQPPSPPPPQQQPSQQAQQAQQAHQQQQEHQQYELQLQESQQQHQSQLQQQQSQQSQLQQQAQLQQQEQQQHQQHSQESLQQSQQQKQQQKEYHPQQQQQSQQKLQEVQEQRHDEVNNDIIDNDYYMDDNNDDSQRMGSSSVNITNNDNDDVDDENNQVFIISKSNCIHLNTNDNDHNNDHNNGNNNSQNIATQKSTMTAIRRRLFHQRRIIDNHNQQENDNSDDYYNNIDRDIQHNIEVRAKLQYLLDASLLGEVQQHLHIYSNILLQTKDTNGRLLLHHAITYHMTSSSSTTTTTNLYNRYNGNNYYHDHYHQYDTNSYAEDGDNKISYQHQHPISYLSASRCSTLQEELFHMIITLYPNACMVQDNDGNLPIHLLLRHEQNTDGCSMIMKPNIRYWLLQQLLHYYPCSVIIPNQYNEIPLHLVLQQQPHHYNVSIMKLLIPITASYIGMMETDPRSAYNNLPYKQHHYPSKERIIQQGQEQQNQSTTSTTSKQKQQQQTTSSSIFPPDIYLPTLLSKQQLQEKQYHYMESFLLTAIQNNAPRCCLHLLIQSCCSTSSSSLSYNNDEKDHHHSMMQQQQRQSMNHQHRQHQAPITTNSILFDSWIQKRQQNHQSIITLPQLDTKNTNNCNDNGIIDHHQHSNVSTNHNNSIGYLPFITALQYQLSFRKLILLLHEFPDIISIRSNDTNDTPLHIASYSYENDENDTDDDDDNHTIDRIQRRTDGNHQYGCIIKYLIHLYPTALLEQNIYHQIPLHCALSYAKDTINIDVMKALTDDQILSSSSTATTSASTATTSASSTATTSSSITSSSTTATINDEFREYEKEISDVSISKIDNTASYNDLSYCHQKHIVSLSLPNNMYHENNNHCKNMVSLNDYHHHHDQQDQNLVERRDEVNDTIMQMEYTINNNPMAMIRDIDGELPLHYLCRHRDISYDKVEYMIQLYPHGVTIQSSKHGHLPVHLAANNPFCNIDIIELLVQYYPDSLMISDHNGDIPLMTSLVSILSNNSNNTCHRYNELGHNHINNNTRKRLSRKALLHKMECIIRMKPDCIYHCNRMTGHNSFHMTCASTFRMTNKKLIEITSNSSTLSHTAYCHNGLLPFHYAILSIHDDSNIPIEHDDDDDDNNNNNSNSNNHNVCTDKEDQFDSPLSRIQYLWKLSPFSYMPLTKTSPRCTYQYHPVCLAASDELYNEFCTTSDDDDDDDSDEDKNINDDSNNNIIDEHNDGDELSSKELMNGQYTSTHGGGNISNTIGCAKHTKRNHNNNHSALQKTISFISDKNYINEKQDLLQLNVIYYLVHQSPELFSIKRS